MQEFVLKIVKDIVDNPDEVTVSESEDQLGTLLKLHVNPEDMGRVIGKSGRVIKALRDLLRVKSIKEGRRVNLVLEESAPQAATI